jgi:alcohol dehydrogenase (cytochrome c)
MEPLVHDGVLFVFSFGDHVQALDAATGDVLWHYARQLPASITPTTRRAMALYGDKLFIGTSDLHEIALDVKTGHVVWDVPLAPATSVAQLTGGPLVAHGKVMQGIAGHWGGNAIVGLDADTERRSGASSPSRAPDSRAGTP